MTRLHISLRGKENRKSRRLSKQFSRRCFDETGIIFGGWSFGKSYVPFYKDRKNSPIWDF